MPEPSLKLGELRKALVFVWAKNNFDKEELKGYLKYSGSAIYDWIDKMKKAQDANDKSFQR